jgi:hypothetical protein
MAVDPGVEEDEAGHKTHALAPAVLEYVPAGHATHTAEEFAPTTFENVPAGHDEHDVAPNDEYLPATHIMHEEQVDIKSTPSNMKFVIKDVVAVLMYSSTTSKPATSAFAFCSKLLTSKAFDATTTFGVVLSIAVFVPVLEIVTPFTVKEYCFVDVMYVNTTVIQTFSIILPDKHVSSVNKPTHKPH